MRMLKTMDEFHKASDNQKKLILYGAGWAGKTVYKFLKIHHIDNVEFAVTAMSESVESEDISISNIDNVLQDNLIDEINIMITVTREKQRMLQEELEKRNIFSYFVISEILLYKMLYEIRRDEAYFHKDTVSSHNKIGYLMPGYLDTDYAERRLIVDKIENVSYIAVPKETEEIIWAGAQYDERPERFRQILEACYCPDKYIPNVELIHTFNSVCKTDRPWCASFETVMPRMVYETEEEKRHYLQLVEYMKKPNCMALYALCKNAYEIQKNSLITASVPSKDREVLMGKTKILHPPQKILVSEDEFEKKHGMKKIHFIFIGRDFFIKGGREVLQVLSEFKCNYDFDLTLISSLQYDDYFTRTSYEEMVRYKKLICESDWIVYYERLPNKKVLDECKEASVGLLPSIADTYGYVVLEMQAAGCPVVSTNVRALPEINNEGCGWICQMPVNQFGFCIEQDKEIWSEILKSELRKCFEDILNHPEKIKEKGRRAMERVREMHDPYIYQKELKKNLCLQ